ncbi:MAG: hypothetical protein ACYC6A_18290 [Armatimonadota bacterium]
MTQPESTTEKKAPTCFRHPDRETWVTCGRCGKSLCPDCMMHGPVGVRCRECLLPQGKAGTAGILDAEVIRQAGRIAALVSVGWVFLLAVIAIFIGFIQEGAAAGAVLKLLTNFRYTAMATREMPGIFLDNVWTPSILLSMIAGGTVGWVVWRICQRAWNTATLRTAAILGASIPFFATLIVAVVLFQLTGGFHFLTVLFIVRALAAVILSTGMAMLLATNNT